MRTLLRSWFFRIFVLLSVGGLCIFNVAMNIEASGAPWIYKAIAASIPYANLIILNLGQAIVAVFLASEFLKQDKKNDTVEVIYARSMSNGQYILGKTLGIMAVFLVLNIIVLVIGIGFSFLNNTATRSVFAYFMYPTLISLPTLVFILGLAFFMMVLVKNQAVTFILLLGYIALSIFYLNTKLFHVFDYIGYNIPMMYSSISGFADINEILYHRLIYFSVGIGLIFLTIYRLPRLPQPSDKAYLSLLLGIAFLFAGAFFVYRYLDLKTSLWQFKNQAVELNNTYMGLPKVSVLKCNLKLEHLSDQIKVEAELLVKNKNARQIDTIVLSLNPSLKINNILYNHRKVNFERKLHLILIKVPKHLLKEDEAIVEIKYEGSIDERICFLDKSRKSNNDNFNAEVFTLRKRYAFLQGNYVCLTSESFWYPSGWTGYANKKPLYYNYDLTQYQLEVKTSPGLTAISQGSSKTTKEGVFIFQPEYPLPKISLLIGPYQKYSVKVDSVQYSVFSIKGNDYFSQSFKDLKDTVTTLIRDLKQEYEAELKFKYPYKRFALVEVPIHFALDKHEYAYTSDAVQPEMVLSSEKGVAYNSSDFRNRKYRIEQEMKRNNEEVLPEEIQARMFKQFVRNNFLTKWDQHYIFRGTDRRTFCLIPQYFTFTTFLDPERWPVLSLSLEAYFNDRSINETRTTLWYEDLSLKEKINLELNGKSLKDLLLENIYQPEEEKEGQEPIDLREIVLLKGKDLLNILNSRYGEKEVDTLFSQFALTNPFRKVPFDDLNLSFQKNLHVNLDSIVNIWYNQKKLPGFVIGDVSSYKVIQGEESKYQIEFTITNTENADGHVTINVEESNPNRKNENWWEDNFNADVSRKIFIPANSTRDIGFIFKAQPTRLAVVTHISRNLPYTLVYNLNGFNDRRNVQAFDGVKPVPNVSSGQNKPEVIIVDNEDKGFSYQQATNKAYIKTLVDKNKQPRYKYTRIKAWSPDREWKAVLRSEFYGNSIHSAYYTRAGTGERKAIWKAALPQSGSYEVYFYYNQYTFGWRPRNVSSNYNLTVYHTGGVEKIDQSTEGIESGWLYLGTFNFSADTAVVELSNKSNGDMIFADAVKWVKAK
jgi:hypothetical protein